MLVFITTAAVWNLNTVQTPTKVQVFQYTTLLPPSSSKDTTLGDRGSNKTSLNIGVACCYKTLSPTYKTTGSHVPEHV